MSLRVADSFLVAGGKVRGLELHRDRFVRSCAAVGVEAGAFFDEQVKRLPGFGRWFPRFELRGSGELAVSLRPAPTQGGRVRITMHHGPDPRSQPRVKGPDLEVLGQVKEAAPYKADDVLLVDSDGTALEATYSAVVWWEDGVLCTPPADRPVLPSVTVRLLAGLAAGQGTELVERTRTPAKLRPTEVWLVNALHGIRPVHAWDDGPIDPLPNSPADHWQHLLTDLARPL